MVTNYIYNKIIINSNISKNIYIYIYYLPGYIDSGASFCSLPTLSSSIPQLNQSFTQYNIHQYDLPNITQADGVFSVRKLILTYSGPLFQIKRINDTNCANVFMDENANIVKLTIVNDSQEITSLADIYAWVGLENNYYADLVIWFDQSGHQRNLLPTRIQGKLQFRLISDKGQFPAVYLEGVSVLSGLIGAPVGAFSAAAFVDFSERKPMSSVSGDYGIVGISTYQLSTDKFTAMFKSYNAQNNLNVHDYGPPNEVKYEKGRIEGRLSAGFTVGPTYRSLFLNGQKLEKSPITTLLTMTQFSLDDQPQFSIGDCLRAICPMPGNEVFEAIFYLYAVDYTQMVNLTLNMTHFFDRNGSLP